MTVIRIFKDFDFLQKTSILRKIEIFWSKFRFLQKTSILSKIEIFYKKLQFYEKLRFFDQNFDFWPKFRFLTKIPIFDQNFDFWPKFRLFTKILIFDQNFENVLFSFRKKVDQNWDFDQNWDYKNLDFYENFDPFLWISGIRRNSRLCEKFVLFWQDLKVNFVNAKKVFFSIFDIFLLHQNRRCKKNYLANILIIKFAKKNIGADILN